MVFHSQVPARYTCRLLAIPCGSVPEDKCKKDNPEDQQRYPFPQLNSSGRLEVRIFCFSMINVYLYVAATTLLIFCCVVIIFIAYICRSRFCPILVKISFVGFLNHINQTLFTYKGNNLRMMKLVL